MKISNSLEQACCVLALIAESHGAPVSISFMNKRMEVSISYLRKITRKLVVAGLIKTISGPTGGYVLAKEMSEINLYMVFEATEGNESFFQPTGVIERIFKREIPRVKKSMNYIEKSFQAAENAWQNSLKEITMDKVVEKSRESEEENE